MVLWNVLAIVSSVFFVLDVAFLCYKRFRKNVYLHVYSEDECFKEAIEGNKKSSICAPKGETLKYVKRYALRKSTYDKSVILSYAEEFDEISYYVLCYNEKHEAIDCVMGTEYDTAITSKIINVSKKTYDVNVIVKSVNGREINKSIIQAMPRSKMRVFSLLYSLAAFSLLFVLRHLSVLIFAQTKAKFYMDSLWNLISIIACLVIALIVYLSSMLSMRKKSMKNRNGGSMEYEFLQ